MKSKNERLKFHVNALGVPVAYESFHYVLTAFYSYLQRIICVRSNFDLPYISHTNAAHKENICLMSDAAGMYQERLIRRLDTRSVSVAYIYAAYVSRVRCIAPYL